MPLNKPIKLCLLTIVVKSVFTEDVFFFFFDKKFMERICSFHLKNIYAKFYASDYYDVNVNKYCVKSSLRFWENKGGINKIDPYGWFQ